ADQRAAAAEEFDALLPHRLQCAGNEGHDQCTDPKEQDAEERDQRRDEEVSAPNLYAVVEDDRHRIFQHRERERAEEQQRNGEQPADDVAMLEEDRQLSHDYVRLSRHDQLQIPSERGQQRLFLDKVGHYDEDENQQRQNREQRVVSDCTGE